MPHPISIHLDNDGEILAVEFDGKPVTTTKNLNAGLDVVEIRLLELLRQQGSNSYCVHDPKTCKLWCR